MITRILGLSGSGLLAALSITATGSVAGAQAVHVVAPGADLQPIVDAAGEGDTLLFSGSDHDGVLIDGKSLTLVSEGAQARVEGITVSNLAADQRVVLRNLWVDAPVTSYGGAEVIQVMDCVGDVWIEECRADEPLWGGILVRDSESVILLRSQFIGHWSVGDYPGVLPSANLGGGASNSNVFAFECEFVGGRAGMVYPAKTTPLPWNPAPGFGMSGGFLFTSGSSFQGGDWIEDPLCGGIVFGSDGLALGAFGLDFAQAISLDCSFEPGTVDPDCGFHFAGEGVGGNESFAVEYLDLTGTSCSLVMEPLVREGESLEGTLTGTPDSLAILALSLAPNSILVAPYLGTLLLSFPWVTYQVVPLGPAGVANVSFPFGSLEPGVESLTIFNQSTLLLPTLSLQICSGSSVVLLDDAF